MRGFFMFVTSVIPYPLWMTSVISESSVDRFARLALVVDGWTFEQ